MRSTRNTRSRGSLPGATNLLFQDYVFRYLLREAGSVKLPVHIHTAVGLGDFYSLSDDNVLQLENILRDPRYEQTALVLLHGGYPLQDQTIWLAARRNVYLDTSLMKLYLYPSEFKQVLRRWLSLFPDNQACLAVNCVAMCSPLLGKCISFDAVP